MPSGWWACWAEGALQQRSSVHSCARALAHACPPSLVPLRAGQALKALPPLLYTMACVNLWVKLQLPHCALLHWAASSAFTLGLQVGMGWKYWLCCVFPA